MSQPLLPLDAVVRVLCFAGRLDVLDLLCRELRTRALSQRLLHAQLYRKVMDDRLPDSAADMAHAFGRGQKSSFSQKKRSEIDGGSWLVADSCFFVYEGYAE
jgi:hypothetical protein